MPHEKVHKVKRDLSALGCRGDHGAGVAVQGQCRSSLSLVAPLSVKQDVNGLGETRQGCPLQPLLEQELWHRSN